MAHNLHDWLHGIYVIVAFCSAFLLGGLKSVLVGPIACLILIFGNVAVILGLFPAHVVWTIYTLVKTDRIDAPLKVGFFLALPVLFAIWLALSITGSVLVGLGYGFFTPWISSFEAFRLDDASQKFYHCIVDGTLGTIKGSCTVVRDFADMCYHSYMQYLKELRESPNSEGLQPLRFIQVPGCITAGLMGLIVEIPFFTIIAVVKSPYMLFKGWQRLIHDLISREGPFLETACIPVAGLTILMWPLVVAGSIVMAVFTSFFVGLYASVIVYQERSFKRGIAYIVAMVAEFDEYTNDWLYLREGSILPKPSYRRKKISDSTEFSARQAPHVQGKFMSSIEAPAMLITRLPSSRSVREAIKEVKMVQVWGSVMRSCEMRGKELLDANVITTSDLYEWLNNTKNNEGNAYIVDTGLPCYSFFQNIVYSIKSGSEGILLHDDLEITCLNRPQDRLLDWLFQPVMLLKEHIKVIRLDECEIKLLEKIVLFGTNNVQRSKAWENGSSDHPHDSLRAAQIEGISRRMIGMVRSITKFPTYRRRFRQIVKALIIYSIAKEASANPVCISAIKEGNVRSSSMRVISAHDIV